MSINGRLDRLESALGLKRVALVICFEAPWRDPAPRREDCLSALVCRGVSGEVQEISENAQVMAKASLRLTITPPTVGFAAAGSTSCFNSR